MTPSLLVLPQKNISITSELFSKRLAQYGIVINPNKCMFGILELDFLAHHVNHNSITPLPDKV